MNSSSLHYTFAWSWVGGPGGWGGGLHPCPVLSKLQILRSNGNQPELSCFDRAAVHTSCRWRNGRWVTALWKYHLEHVSSLSRRTTWRGWVGFALYMDFNLYALRPILFPRLTFLCLALHASAFHYMPAPFTSHSGFVPLFSVLISLPFSFGIGSHGDLKRAAMCSRRRIKWLLLSRLKRGCLSGPVQLSSLRYLLFEGDHNLFTAFGHASQRHPPTGSSQTRCCFLWWEYCWMKTTE